MIERCPASLESLDDFRRRARAWIQSNLQLRTEPACSNPVEYYTPDVVAENRVLQRKLWEGGYAGIDWPEEYGGQGLSAAHTAAFLQEARGYQVPDFGILAATTFEVCVPTMIAHAPPAFLADFVPKVLAGEALVCQYFSEPQAGSDLAGVRTRAVRTAEGWVLNGQKVWSTYAHLADWGMCLARTDWDVPKHRGLTWFAVPCAAPGVITQPIKQINGTSEFCEEFFDDVTVPDEWRISDVNAGWPMAQTMLALERGAGHAQDRWAVTAGTVSSRLVKLAREADRLEDPATRQLLVETQVIDTVERALRARIQEHSDLGSLDTATAAYGKLFSGVYDPVRARIMIEIGGAESLGWSSEDDDGAATATTYLDARVYAIAGGTNEMQRNGIAERGLALPREPSYDTKRPFREVLQDTSRWGAS